MRRGLFVCALSALTTARIAGAQSIPPGTELNSHRVQLGIGGGAVVPLTDARYQDVLAGANGQAYLLIRLIPGFPALRIGADYARMKFGKPTGTISGVPEGSTRTQLGGIASLRFDLLPGAVRPYVLAGVGAFNIRDALANGGSLQTTLSSTQFGLDGGAGLAVRLGRISAFLESRIQNVYTKQAGLIDTKSIQAIPVTFGLAF